MVYGEDETIRSLGEGELVELGENLRHGVPIATPVFDGASEDERSFVATDDDHCFSVDVQLGEMEASRGFGVLDNWARNRVLHPDKSHVAVLVTEVVSDRLRGHGVVAGDHLHPDAGARAFGHGGDRLRTRRIDQADEAEKERKRLEAERARPRKQVWICYARRRRRHPRRRPTQG